MTSLIPGALDPHPVAPPGTEPLVAQLLNWLMYGGLVACIVGFILAFIGFMISNEGMGNQHVRRLGYVAVGGVGVMIAASIAQTLIH